MSQTVEGDELGEGSQVLPASLVTIGQSLREANAALLTLLASQTKLAAQHALRAARFESLHHVSTTMVASLDLDVISAAALGWLGAQLPLDEARLFLCAPNEQPNQTRLWRPEALQPLTTAEPTSAPLPPVLASGAERMSATVDTQGRAVLALALRNEQQLCGALELVVRGGATLGNEELALLAAFAPPLALAISNAHLHQERGRVAQQLVQSEKLASVGRLAASIAHEVNNPLHAIYNSLDILLTREVSDEKRQRYLAMAHDEAQRLIGVVQRVLDFHRPTREGMRPAAVADLLDIALDDAAPQLQQSGTRIVRQWPSALPHVLAIRSHLRQVFSNLIANAIESMPTGGTLTIRASAKANAGDTTPPTLTIEFNDTGNGIAADELHKIFEPFYTTKLTGTGLGLAISYNIVQQHGGELSVQSVPGQGTTFVIQLPAAE